MMADNRTPEQRIEDLEFELNALRKQVLENVRRLMEDADVQCTCKTDDLEDDDCRWHGEHGVNRQRVSVAALNRRRGR